jgi:opacity protein-like surface antigen
MLLHPSIRGAAATLLVLASTAAPTLAQRRPDPYADENSIRVRIGVFQPRADSDYFDDVFDDFTGSESDLVDGMIGVEYAHAVQSWLDVSIGGSYYETAPDQSYRRFEDSRGHRIRHTLSLAQASFDVGLRLKLAPAHSRVRPYLGGGGSLVAWRLAEDGDFIDFNEPREVFSDRFESEGETFGYFLLAGVEVALSRDWALFVEGRHLDAEDDLDRDFEDLGKLDLAGESYAAGVALRF